MLYLLLLYTIIHGCYAVCDLSKSRLVVIIDSTDDVINTTEHSLINNLLFHPNSGKGFVDETRVFPFITYDQYYASAFRKVEDVAKNFEREWKENEQIKHLPTKLVVLNFISGGHTLTEVELGFIANVYKTYPFLYVVAINILAKDIGREHLEKISNKTYALDQVKSNLSKLVQDLMKPTCLNFLFLELISSNENTTGTSLDNGTGPISNASAGVDNEPTKLFDSTTGPTLKTVNFTSVEAATNERFNNSLELENAEEKRISYASPETSVEISSHLVALESSAIATSGTSIPQNTTVSDVEATTQTVTVEQSTTSSPTASKAQTTPILEVEVANQTSPATLSTTGSSYTLKHQTIPISVVEATTSKLSTTMVSPTTIPEVESISQSVTPQLSTAGSSTGPKPQTTLISEVDVTRQTVAEELSTKSSVAPILKTTQTPEVEVTSEKVAGKPSAKSSGAPILQTTQTPEVEVISQIVTEELTTKSSAAPILQTTQTPEVETTSQTVAEELTTKGSAAPNFQTTKTPELEVTNQTVTEGTPSIIRSSTVPKPQTTVVPEVEVTGQPVAAYPSSTNSSAAPSLQTTQMPEVVVTSQMTTTELLTIPSSAAPMPEVETTNQTVTAAPSTKKTCTKTKTQTTSIPKIETPSQAAAAKIFTATTTTAPALQSSVMPEMELTSQTGTTPFSTAIPSTPMSQTAVADLEATSPAATAKLYTSTTTNAPKPQANQLAEVVNITIVIDENPFIEEKPQPQSFESTTRTSLNSKETAETHSQEQKTKLESQSSEEEPKAEFPDFRDNLKVSSKCLTKVIVIYQYTLEITSSSAKSTLDDVVWKIWGLRGEGFAGPNVGLEVVLYYFNETDKHYLLTYGQVEDEAKHFLSKTKFSKQNKLILQNYQKLVVILLLSGHQTLNEPEFQYVAKLRAKYPFLYILAVSILNNQNAANGLNRISDEVHYLPEIKETIINRIQELATIDCPSHSSAVVTTELAAPITAKPTLKPTEPPATIPLPTWPPETPPPQAPLPPVRASMASRPVMHDAPAYRERHVPNEIIAAKAIVTKATPGYVPVHKTSYGKQWCFFAMLAAIVFFLIFLLILCMYLAHKRHKAQGRSDRNRAKFAPNTYYLPTENFQMDETMPTQNTSGGISNVDQTQQQTQSGGFESPVNAHTTFAA